MISKQIHLFKLFCNSRKKNVFMLNLLIFTFNLFIYLADVDDCGSLSFYILLFLLIVQKQDFMCF